MVGVRETCLTTGSGCCAENGNPCWASITSISHLMQIQNMMGFAVGIR